MAEIRIISTRFKQIRKYKDEKITTLLGLIVVGGVKVRKNTSILFNYCKRII